MHRQGKGAGTLRLRLQDLGRHPGRGPLQRRSRQNRDPIGCDYNPAANYNNLLDRVIRHRDAIISHLNWVCIFLGFHSFGLYIHNDTMQALGRPQDMFSDTAIQLQPVFAQWVHFCRVRITLSTHG